MALVLAIGLDEDFYVKDTRVSLDSITHELKFKLKVHGSAMDNVYEITDKHALEILPNVRVSAGTNADLVKGYVKVVIDAPKTIKILREDLYNEAHNGSDDSKEAET